MIRLDPVGMSLVAVATFAALWTFWAIARPDSLRRSVVKTLAVAALAVAALWFEASPWLVAALALGAVGDWFLSRPDARAFQIGAASFAMGHLAYAGLFLTHRQSDPSRLMVAPRPVLLAIIAALGAALAVLFWRRAGAERGAVLAYIPFILAMAVAALSVKLIGPLAWVPLAVAAFLGSDLLLALTRFGVLRRSVLTDRLVWVSYIAAQLCFFTLYGWYDLK